MNKVSLIVLLGCFVFLISCRQETGKLFENNKVTFTSEQQSFRDGKDCDLPDSLMNDCATLNIAHLQPQSKNTDLNKAVKDTIEYYIKRMIGDCIFPEKTSESDKFISVDSLSKLYFAQHRDFIIEFPDAAGKVWNIDISVDSVFQNPKVLCLSVNGYTFLGGAHPNTFTTFHNFDKATGKTLTLNDIISDMEAFRKIAETEFRKNQELTENQDLEEAGYFFDNGVYSLPSQFAVTDKGLMMFYNAYEAAAYVVGQISFTIPYDALDQVVKMDRVK
ncbi:MAG: DUF3298 domain-containing protein [Saprospiraceae bacterium]|nr:DUF3298 domain-containing protein [Saprospiraceae bacterium]